jgi:hypothetical protein
LILPEDGRERDASSRIHGHLLVVPAPPVDGLVLNLN